MRTFSYEAALRTHQTLAFALAYGLWRHISPTDTFPGLYLYVGGALFIAFAILWLLSVLYRNRSGFSTAQISYNFGALKVTLDLPRPLKVKAGQYVCLWIPWAGFGAVAQSHPFTIISWSNEPQEEFELFIEPRRGFTKKLLSLSAHGPTKCIAMFSGPHGKHLPVDQYENIIMLATDFGVAAHLPYLKKLVHDERSRSRSSHMRDGHSSEASSKRRVHLVWQIDRGGKEKAK